MVAPVTEKKWIDTEPLAGELNMDKDNFGKFLGKGGQSLKKFVTGKSAFQIKEAYGRDKASDDGKTNPAELGPVFVNVKLDDSGEKIAFSISIRNEKEDLTKYLSIAKSNLFKHAANCAVKKAREDTFTHKMVFSAGMSHSGCIGKFIGSSGKNIRQLGEDLKSALNVPFVFVSMIEANENEMKKKPWGNKVLSIETPDDCNTEVHVLVCANLPRDAQFRDIMGKVVPLVSESVAAANPRPSRDVETVSASEFVPGWTEFVPGSFTETGYRPPSPGYSPGTPDAGW